jgi:arylsulfatase A-like enzyme
MKRLRRACRFGPIAGCVLFGTVLSAAPPQPNVVVVIVDDLGYGDLSCHGSPFVKTPRIDALHGESVRLVDFHVAPMCSPTRGQLLTGVDAVRNGSTVVAGSRMFVRPEIPMAPRFFAQAGYATGQFGKWHLGENPPHRPQDRGFAESLWFPLQQISSLPDHWDNDYFNPTLRRGDGTEQAFTGYCTDIFFSEAIAWMRRQQESARPFFCYLPLNACHGPQWAPEDLRKKIAAEFPKLSPGQVGYLAMLANVDTNMGRLDAFLDKSGLRDDTIVVFLSDNGGYALIGGYNAGMRGGKSSLTEGGHRVPCFVRLPRGLGGGSGRDVSGLTQVQDLLPTLLDLCGLSEAQATPFDGISLAPALRGEAAVPDRTLVVQYGHPKPFQLTCVMRGTWRLLSDPQGREKGKPELYNLADDPFQAKNLFQKEAARATELRAAYDAWWSRVAPQVDNRSGITVGSEHAGPIALSCAEWREHPLSDLLKMREGVKRRGVWDLDIARNATAEIALSRWPESSGLALNAAAAPWTPHDTGTPEHAGYPAGKALPIATAHVRVGSETFSKPVAATDRSAVFSLPLESGRTELEGWFTDAEGNDLGAGYFATVTVR